MKAQWGFKRQSGLAPARWRGLTPDKLRLVPDGCVELLLRDVG